MFFGWTLIFLRGKATKDERRNSFFGWEGGGGEREAEDGTQ